MAVKVLKDGSILLDFRPDGKWGKRERHKFPPGTDIEKVMEFEKSIKLIRRKNKQPSLMTDITFNNLYYKYLDWVSLHQSERTWKEKKYVFEREYKNFFKNINVTDITIQHIIAFQNYRKAKKVSNRTINLECDYLSAFFKWCRKIYNLDINIKIEKLKYQRPIPKIPTFEEIIKIIENAEEFYRTIFLFLYALGLRFSEMANLKWEDIDYNNKTVTIYGKGGKIRRLPLPNIILESLNNIEKKSEYIFPSQKGTGKIKDIRKAIKRAIRRANLNIKITPHQLRHAFATHLMSKNINIRIIQKLLGHKAITTTEFYTHVTTEHLKEATLVLFENKNINIMSTGGGNKIKK